MNQEGSQLGHLRRLGVTAIWISPIFKQVCASVIWFGSTGAEYAPADAMFGDSNLITVKPLVGIEDAIALLCQSTAKGLTR